MSSAFDVTFLDSSGVLNLFARLSKAMYLVCIFERFYITSLISIISIVITISGGVSRGGSVPY